MQFCWLLFVCFYGLNFSSRQKYTVLKKFEPKQKVFRSSEKTSDFFFYKKATVIIWSSSKPLINPWLLTRFTHLYLFIMNVWEAKLGKETFFFYYSFFSTMSEPQLFTKFYKQARKKKQKTRWCEWEKLNPVFPIFLVYIKQSPSFCYLFFPLKTYGS